MAKRGRQIVSGGRPPGSASGSSSAPSASKDHNMTDDQEQKLVRDHMAQRNKLIEAEKSAKSARMNFDKIIKSDLGSSGLAMIKLLEILEKDDGEDKMKAEMERNAKVMRWAGMQIGMQGSLFEDDRRSLAERAYAEGKSAGMGGKDPKSPYTEMEASSEFMRGWHDGQSIQAGGIKSTKKKDDIVKADGAKKASGPDDFDKTASSGTAGETEWPDDKQTAAAKAAVEASAVDGKPSVTTAH